MDMDRIDSIEFILSQPTDVTVRHQIVSNINVPLTA